MTDTETEESRVIRVVHNGYPRTFDSPAEDAELVIWCAEAQTECDAMADPNPVYSSGETQVYVTCRGDASHASHEFYAALGEGE